MNDAQTLEGMEPSASASQTSLSRSTLLTMKQSAGAAGDANNGSSSGFPPNARPAQTMPFFGHRRGLIAREPALT
jgi:hypothetical protein